MTETRLRITCVVGTRPEAIKMAPVIRDLRQRPWASVRVLATSQHRDMVMPVLRFFEIAIDRDLDVMTVDQTLTELTNRLLERLSAEFTLDRPDLVVAQGDTTTVMATALTCFYSNIVFAHVEAGLRTGDLQQPFPEEFNRIVASRIARLNFAPTPGARDNLLREGIDPATIFVTGNPIVDALLWTAERSTPPSFLTNVSGRLMLVTLHRRESFGKALANVLSAIRRIVADNPNVVVVYPVHPNPQIARPAFEMLGDIGRIHLCAPLTYPEFVATMQRADVILTDSGGIQEEASVLRKPVFVVRDRTERSEAIAVGVARLVGTDPADLGKEAI